MKYTSMPHISLALSTAKETCDFHYTSVSTGFDTNENYYKFSVLQTENSWDTFSITYANEPAIQGTSDEYKTYKLKTATYRALPSFITFYKNNVNIAQLTFTESANIVTIIVPSTPGFTMIAGVNPDIKNKTFGWSSNTLISFDNTQVQNFGVSLYPN